MHVSIQMQMRLYCHVVHFCKMFTSFKSLPTSLSYDFLESETLPKSSFSAAINDSMEPNTCGRVCISSPVSLQYSCWMSLGSLLDYGRDFCRISVKQRQLFFKTLKSSPVASTNHKACRHDIPLSAVYMHF